MKLLHTKWLLGALAIPLVAAGLGAAGFASLRAKPAPQGQLLPLAEAERILLAAAREGDVEVVAGLLKAGVSAEARDPRGYTPLILAAYHGHLEAVEALLAAGADACAGDRRGNTALMGAAFKGYTPIVDLLTAQPCSVDQTNALGQTALMFSSLVGRSDVVARLRSRGADAGRRDGMGRSAGDWAATQGHDLESFKPTAQGEVRP